MAFQPSSEIIEALKSQLGLNEDFLALLKIWEKELGALAGRVKIAGFKKGQLFVDVSSSAHMQEMTIRKKELIKKINQHFAGKKPVKDIKLKLS